MVAQPLTHESHSPASRARGLLWAEFEMKFARQLRARRELDELRSFGAPRVRILEAEQRLISLRHEVAVLRASLTRIGRRS